jgi:queuosine precursor transporter
MTLARSNPPASLDPALKLYIWLASIYVTALLMANVLGVKLFQFNLVVPSWFPLGTSDGGTKTLAIEHTVGMISFPITFLLTDLLNEYYGKKATRRVALLAFSMAALAFGLIWVGRRVPILEGIPGTATPEAFENIFGAASFMYLASITAFLLGSMLDIFLFGVFNRLTKGRRVWLRTTGSTIISQIFDSFVVTFVFFVVLQRLTGGTPSDMGFVLQTAATGYILKFFIAVALTPLIYAGRWAIERFIGLGPLPPDS